MIQTNGLSGKDLEAVLFLETAESLGLSQVMDRSETLAQIKIRIL